MVRNGQKIIFLTDTNARSGGDIIPHLFRNNDAASPGDLGYGVNSQIVGDIDGRLFAAASNPCYLFTNVSNDPQRSSFEMRLEYFFTIIRNGNNAYTFNNQSPVIKPDLLLNMDIENTYWLDTGVKGVYPKNPVDGGTDLMVLPLAAGVTQPIYGTEADNVTWRDRSLEACIMMLIPKECFGARRDTRAVMNKEINKEVMRYIEKSKSEVNLEEREDREKGDLKFLLISSHIKFF